MTPLSTISSRAETGFVYIAGISQSMTGAAYIPQGSRSIVVIETTKCANQLDGMRVIEIG